MKKSPQTDNKSSALNSNARYIVELLGVFYVVIAFQNSYLKMYGNFAIAAAYAVANYFSFHISGGHLNPAVTFCIFLNESSKEKPKYSFDDALRYFVCQAIGGLFATIVSRFMGGKVIDVGISPTTTDGLGFFFEITMSILLCIVYSHLSESQNDPLTNAFAIFSVYFVALYAIGPFTSGLINPAVGIALVIGRSLIIGGNDMNVIWIYLFAPVIGGYIAHFIHEKYQRPLLVDNSDSQ